MSNIRNEILLSAAKRLGLEEETNVIKKADELNRLLCTKPSVKTLSASASAVMCLDLSSRIAGVPFDKETALKLSGLKKTPYNTKLHMLEKVLELDKQLTIKEICVQHSCTVVMELAEKIYNAYKEKALVEDLTHPQYATIAVYMACKLKKVTVQKSNLLTLSRLKAGKWKDLETQFDDFCKENNFTSSGTGKKSNKNEMHEYLEQFVANNPHEKTKTNASEIIEEYEVWKNRIIKEAREALKNNKH